MKIPSRRLSLTFALIPLTFVGCSTESTNTETLSPRATVDAHEDHAEQPHPSEGPHHGGLIELGNEEYHAELVHNEPTGSVTIYVLNATATEQVPIDSTEITINVKHDGKPEQFKLAASPDAGDPQGNSSRFISTDAKLGEHLDEEDAEPKLVVTIEGKSFRGTISHEHDHKGNEHEGHDH